MSPRRRSNVVRAAAVLGFVGAGGIGYEISVSMRLFDYGQVLTLLLVFIALLAVPNANRGLTWRSFSYRLVFGESAMEIVDTHQHLWDLNLFRYSWLSSIPSLNRSFCMADYLEAASGLHVNCGDCTQVAEKNWRPRQDNFEPLERDEEACVLRVRYDD
jgi:hypothetical protein